MRVQAAAGLCLTLACVPIAGCGPGDEPSLGERAAAAGVRGVDRALEERTLNQLDQVRLALERHAIDHDGSYPAAASLDGIERDLVPRYLPRLETRDAWGNPMSYSSDGRGFTVSSAGDDGRAGTADDLVARDGSAPGRP